MATSRQDSENLRGREGRWETNSDKSDPATNGHRFDFPLRDLLNRFEPNGNARFVEFTTIVRPDEMIGQRLRFPPLLRWPYREGLRLDEALHPLTIMAVGLYGETLTRSSLLDSLGESG